MSFYLNSRYPTRPFNVCCDLIGFHATPLFVFKSGSMHVDMPDVIKFVRCISRPRKRVWRWFEVSVAVTGPKTNSSFLCLDTSLLTVVKYEAKRINTQQCIYIVLSKTVGHK